MDTGDFLKATCTFLVPGASNPCIMVWDFEATTVTSPFDLNIDGEAIAAALVTRYYTPLASVISEQVVMSGISLRNYGDSADGYDLVTTLFQGSSSSYMLPPFVTYGIQLTRQNYAMRNGRKAYPGAVVASVGPSGDTSAAVKTLFGSNGAAWASTDMTVEGESSDITFSPRIVREPLTPGVNPTVYSRITNYGTVYFGSQNTRKG